MSLTNSHQGEKSRNDFQGTRVRDVIYGLEPPSSGVFTGPPPGSIPWTEEYGTVVRETLGREPGANPVDFITQYTESMKLWLSDVFATGGNSIPVVTGRPKQAYSHYWYALPDEMKAKYIQACEGGGPDASGLTDEQKNVPPPGMTYHRYPLPFISFFPSSAPKRRDGRSSLPLRNLTFLDRDRTKTGWAKYPTPYLLTFQIDVWTKYETMHNWMYSLFDQAFQQEISHLAVPNPYFKPEDGGESILGAIHWKEDSDNSDLEISENTDSIFRWTMSVEVEAWRFYEMRQAPTAKKFTTEVTDYSGPGSDTVTQTVDFDPPAES